MDSFSRRVLSWFDIHGRKHLPWQQRPSAYKTWVSEIMLQQTQVATVIPYFNRFIETFPTEVSLANATLDDVLAHWAGLGYYSRARNLHKAAQLIRDRHNGVFPCHIDDVIALPGIGKSTAGAILSLSFNQRHAILDGNVKRVLSRHQMIDGVPNQAKTLKKQWQVAEQFTPKKDTNKYTQAMMDLGAMICTRTKPDCDSCPVHIDCQAKLHDKIGEYPNKKPKKILPEKQIIALIITDGEKVYLEKRPNRGIWGGLWSLPEIPINHSVSNQSSKLHNLAISNFLTQYQLKETKRHRHNIYTHVFTHYRLYIHPICLWVNLSHFKKTENLFTLEECQHIGLPTPIQKILGQSL